MNKITSIILTLLTVGCANYSNNQAESNSIDKQELKNEITIDSVIVEEKELKDICFVIYKSTFPKIKGLLDKNFENQLNDIFSKNFNSYIDNAEKEYGGGCLDTENTDEDRMQNIPAAASSSFEVLTKNDSIISVVQLMIADVGHGGNAWTPSSISLTADVKNKIIYGNKEFKIDRNKTDHLNTKIKTYFDKLFPDQKKSNGIDYPLIKTSDDINKLSFGLRNDSLVLIIQAYPTTHSSYTTYIIPIDQVKQ